MRLTGSDLISVSKASFYFFIMVIQETFLSAIPSILWLMIDYSLTITSTPPSTTTVKVYLPLIGVFTNAFHLTEKFS